MGISTMNFLGGVLLNGTALGFLTSAWTLDFVIWLLHFDSPRTEPCLGRWSPRGTLRGLGERRPRCQVTMLRFGLLNF